MPNYLDRDGTSGVSRFEEGPDWIELTFKDGRVYRYDIIAPGRAHLEAMKRRAHRGRGLLTYVNQHVREHYAERKR